jgi:hypothetical protein
MASLAFTAVFLRQTIVLELHLLTVHNGTVTRQTASYIHHIIMNALGMQQEPAIMIARDAALIITTSLDVTAILGVLGLIPEAIVLEHITHVQLIGLVKVLVMLLDVRLSIILQILVLV